MTHSEGTLSQFGIGSLKLANSVGNINTAKTLKKKTEINLIANLKGPHHLGQVIVCIIFICISSMLIQLFFKQGKQSNKLPNIISTVLYD